MCSIVGAIIWLRTPLDSLTEIDKNLNELMSIGVRRGRDGRGYHLIARGHVIRVKSINRVEKDHSFNEQILRVPYKQQTFLGNLRAEPTTEYVEQKKLSDQQPYEENGWHIVHNGTIANDKDLRFNVVPTRIDSAAIVEQLSLYDVSGDKERAFNNFQKVICKLKGSYAILAAHKSLPGVIFYACNYRPIWVCINSRAIYFSSTRDMPGIPTMITPYTMGMLSFSEAGDLETEIVNLHGERNKRSLVVCSGGLDSVVSASFMKQAGYDVHLIHFMYGSRAEEQEVEAIKNIAKHMEMEVTFFPLPVYKTSDSPLLDSAAKVAGGEAGAEFAHEWVPARNLLLLSVATAFAEANGFDNIVLGNNLEEAGAYPDNEPEFIDKFNDILPFAVGDGKNIVLLMPVGNMMKHEIVDLGLKINAPLHLTWSCYRNGPTHCGTCGPCYMRRKAFEINGAAEVIQYANEF
jgi:7-cyano-7-deazaguanine synthase